MSAELASQCRAGRCRERTEGLTCLARPSRRVGRRRCTQQLGGPPRRRAAERSCTTRTLLRVSAGPFGGLFGAGQRSSSRGSGGSGPEQQQPGVLEGDEGGKMVQLDGESSGSLDGSSEEPFGPLAILAVGFSEHEFGQLRRLLLEDMAAEMVQVIPAPAAALAGSLGAALEAEPLPGWEAPPLGTRRVVFLSGMYAAEVMETISAYREAGLPESVFAAAVPNNYHRPLAELVQEVFADHAAMTRQRRQAAAERQQGMF